MEQHILNLMSCAIGAILGAYMAIKINSANRKIAAVEKMLSGDGAPVVQGAVGSPMVRPLQLVPDDPPRLLKRLEHLLPDTLFVETPKEPLTDPVLFWDRGGDEFLLQTVVATGSRKHRL